MTLNSLIANPCLCFFFQKPGGIIALLDEAW